MLNVRPIFEDAIHAFSEYESYLRIPSLPSTVFLMQCDVINHYRYAITHYLPHSLNANFLQNSSIGTPYQKWAKFTNEDFDELSFAITNLLRYTGRLIHETKSEGLKANRHFAESGHWSSIYIDTLVDVGHFGKQIGIRIQENETLAITSFPTQDQYEGILSTTQNADGSAEQVHITLDQAGNQHERRISRDEYLKLSQALRPTDLLIHDRSVIARLVGEGLAEIESLRPLNREFGALCNSYIWRHRIAEPFDVLVPSWLI